MADRELALTCPHCGKPASESGANCASCGKPIGEAAISSLGDAARMAKDALVVDGHVTVGAEPHFAHACAKCGAKMVPIDNACPYCQAPAGAKRVELHRELHVHGTLEIKGGAQLIIKKR